MTEPLPPDLIRGLTSPRLSRRRFLEVGGLAALGLPLAACSIAGARGGGDLSLGAARRNIAKFWAGHKKTGTLNFENWPLYIDVRGNSSDSPSLDLFTHETGIKVNYSTGIQQVDSYYAKVEPILASGQGIGKDIIVITNGLFLDKLINLDFLIPLDQSGMPNFYSYASEVAKDPSYDRGNVYTMTWQSGITGIGYDPTKVGREITSWQDLQDPKLSGKIGMFGDNEDLPGCALLAVGVNPENSTVADWHKAADWLKKQRPLVRKYYEQDYIKPLSDGDIYATMAWSGDIYQARLDNPNLKFVVPKEGALLWSDNMCIPLHAQHPVDAMTYMDWVYQPKPAAMIAEYVNYITPVSAAQGVISADAKAAAKPADKQGLEALASSPLIFPSKDDYSRLHRYRVLTRTEEATWNSLFQPVYQS